MTQATWLDSCCCSIPKEKKIVTGRDPAAAWQIALLAITYDGHSVLTQLILGDQSVVKRVFLSRRQTPTIWIQTAVSINAKISAAVVESAMVFCNADRCEMHVADVLQPIMIAMPDRDLRVSGSPARSASACA